MDPSAVDRALARQGLILIIGSLVFRRPWFPTLIDRALLVLNAIPRWAIASGVSSGWVWTGMGNPEPWSVLREEKPGISPIDRAQWKARIRTENHEMQMLAQLKILTPFHTARELLLGDGPLDVCASQVLMLAARHLDALEEACHSRRASAQSRRHAREVLDRVRLLIKAHPDMTLYTS
jgi:hypothetical protein